MCHYSDFYCCFCLARFDFVAFHVPLSPTEGTSLIISLLILPFCANLILRIIPGDGFEFFVFVFSSTISPCSVCLCRGGGKECYFIIPLKFTFVLAVRPGSVRNIIQQFENSTETGEEVSDGADPQRLSFSSLGDEMDR